MMGISYTGRRDPRFVAIRRGGDAWMIRNIVYSLSGLLTAQNMFLFTFARNIQKMTDRDAQ